MIASTREMLFFRRNFFLKSFNKLPRVLIESGRHCIIGPGNHTEDKKCSGKQSTRSKCSWIIKDGIYLPFYYLLIVWFFLFKV
jgi:hypothetical protein